MHNLDHLWQMWVSICNPIECLAHKNHGILSAWWFGDPRTLQKTGSNSSKRGFNDSYLEDHPS